jgi:hypothetical protein
MDSGFTAIALDDYVALHLQANPGENRAELVFSFCRSTRQDALTWLRMSSRYGLEWIWHSAPCGTKQLAR